MRLLGTGEWEEGDDGRWEESGGRRREDAPLESQLLMEEERKKGGGRRRPFTLPRACATTTAPPTLALHSATGVLCLDRSMCAATGRKWRARAADPIRGGAQTSLRSASASSHCVAQLRWSVR